MSKAFDKMNLSTTCTRLRESISKLFTFLIRISCVTPHVYSLSLINELEIIFEQLLIFIYFSSSFAPLLMPTCVSLSTKKHIFYCCVCCIWICSLDINLRRRDITLSPSSIYFISTGFRNNSSLIMEQIRQYSTIIIRLF